MFSGLNQFDAVAENEADDELRGGSGAQAVEGRERKRTMEKGENEKNTGHGYL